MADHFPAHRARVLLVGHIGEFQSLHRTTLLLSLLLERDHMGPLGMASLCEMQVSECCLHSLVSVILGIVPPLTLVVDCASGMPKAH